MKKVFILLSIIFMGLVSLAQDDTNYAEIYEQLDVPTFEYLHGKDPGEYQDGVNSSWSLYPLFRLTSALYFKSITIEPGYYLLTPRQYENNWYMLFKEGGIVKYIIPIYNRDLTPEAYYEQNQPEVEKTISQKIHLAVLDFVGRIFPSSKREPAPNNYLELQEYGDNFVSIVIYWGDYKYFTVFRTVPI
ncbi:MAG: hypothetical protein R3Y28_00990 [Candidatus Gastranaerophilales bacterium]